MKTKILLAFTLVCLISCKKEKIDNPCQDDSLLRQIETNDVVTHGLTYNENCTIYESVEPFIYKKYYYNTSNKLIKVERAVSFSAFSCVMQPGIPVEEDPRKAKITDYSEFEYASDGKLTKKISYFFNPDIAELGSYQTYEYDSNRIVKINIYNAQNNLIQYQQFAYDVNGNMIREEFYIQYDGIIAPLQSYSEYEFDNNHNPYLILSDECVPGKFTNRNNILKTTIVNYYSVEEYRYSIQNTYEYNESGYPVVVNGANYIYGK